MLYFRNFLSLIVCASVAFNIFFIATFLGVQKQIAPSFISEPNQASEMTWPSAFGSYRVFFNYVPSVFKFNYTDTITYSTHATPDFLFHLEELASRWRGPISVAVYAPGSDFDLATRIIRYLHQCANESVRYYVSFHLFFKQEEFNATSGNKQFPAYSPSDDPTPFDCLLRSNKNFYYQTFRKKKNITYPVNVARNIARVLASTYYVLTSDIELYPSLDFIPMFLQMIQQESTVVKTRRVYVLPVYEVEKNFKLPANKEQLVQLVRAGLAVSFHRFLCRTCHQIPDEERWFNTTSNHLLEVFSVSEIKQRWEPIFVGTNNDPLYNERLSWEGMNDKMSHMYEMCLMSYKLLILDDAFLVHAPAFSPIDYTEPFDCLLRSNKDLRQTYRKKKNFSYPVNVARNIARVLASTYYVLPSDIELFPSLDFIPMFLQMIQRESAGVTAKRLYVLPVYEVEKKVELPDYKQQLVQLVRNGLAVSFHRFLCIKCHQIPNEEGWLRAPSNQSLEVFNVTDIRQKWEPIFVGTNDEPLYNQLLSWEGMRDKMTHMYEMCLMNYKVFILDEAFLVHAPGIKKDTKKSLGWRKTQFKEQANVLKKVKAGIDAQYKSKGK
uniref:N-acetyllactosaminide beta-1,3-N-acetylglucosaminyltransferase n=1 Tax=Strigamia maritima TaxID=126957 RepID=T1JJI3_STRMM